MSIDAPPTANRSAVLRFALLLAIALTVLGLQIALPWISYVWAWSDEDLELEPLVQIERSRFWNYFCFAHLLNQLPPRFDPFILDLSSIAITDDEIIVVWPRFPDWGITPTTDRLDLKTGRVQSSVTSDDIGIVLADSSRLWWFPLDPEGRQVILHGGRPVGFERVESTYGSRFRLLEFVDGKWHPLDQFAFIPTDIPLVFHSDRATGKLAVIVGPHDSNVTCYFLPDVRLESASEYEARTESASVADRRLLEEMTASELKQLSWIGYDEAGTFDYPIGNLVDWGILSVLGERSNERARMIATVWTRISPNGQTESETVPVPVRHAEVSMVCSVNLIKSPAGRIFLLMIHNADGRWTVLEWDKGRWQIVLQQYSPLLTRVLIDGALLAGLAIAIPMLVLGLLAWLVDSRSRRLTTVSLQSVELSSVVRRGCARAVDLATWLPLLVLSVILHPEAIDWWHEVIELGARLPRAGLMLIGDPTFGNLAIFQQFLLWLANELLHVPMVAGLALPGLAIVVGQIVAQGLSGRTLGKWLLGLTVVRTTGQRCGWSRSLLRELLLVIDSLCLVSWVPGVICILATGKSQRLGDWMSGTIVIRR